MIGGIGAVLWAMRDRLVSIALPREPEVPALRVPDRPGTGHAPSTAGQGDGGREESSVEPEPRTVTEVKGIGPVYATRLEAADITTLADLAKSAPEAVAEAAGVPESSASGWIDSARGLLKG